MIYITEILKTFISLFVIMNPFAAIPLYLTLTTNMQAEQREKIIKICSLSVFVVLFISAIAGEIILKVFGISIAAFQVGGGVLLSIIAYGMLSAKDEESTSDLKKENSILNKSLGVAVVPLTIPMLTGPGAMSMTIVTASKSHNMMGYVYVIISALLISFVVFLILRSAGKIKMFLGETGMSIMTKVLSMLLMALAVELIANGVRVLLPGLGFVPN
jgi:multiple antibiotic resistance protein